MTSGVSVMWTDPSSRSPACRRASMILRRSSRRPSSLPCFRPCSLSLLISAGISSTMRPQHSQPSIGFERPNSELQASGGLVRTILRISAGLNRSLDSPVRIALARASIIRLRSSLLIFLIAWGISSTMRTVTSMKMAIDSATPTDAPIYSRAGTRCSAAKAYRHRPSPSRWCKPPS